MVQRVQVDVHEELAGQIPDGQPAIGRCPMESLVKRSLAYAAAIAVVNELAFEYGVDPVVEFWVSKTFRIRQPIETCKFTSEMLFLGYFGHFRFPQHNRSRRCKFLSVKSKEPEILRFWAL